MTRQTPTPASLRKGTRLERPSGRRAARPLLALVLIAFASCDRPAERTADARPRAPRYDADSAARGLLTPELARLLAVEPLLDGRETALQWKCTEDTLERLGHVRRRFVVDHAEASAIIFARATAQGELRRVEVHRRGHDASVLAATWDAAENAAVVSEIGGPTVKRTTLRDPDAPLTRALLYVGKRVLATPCPPASRAAPAR